MKETAPACSRHQRGLPARPPLPEQLLPRLQMKGPTSLPSPAGPPPPVHHLPRYSSMASMDGCLFTTR